MILNLFLNMRFISKVLISAYVLWAPVLITDTVKINISVADILYQLTPVS